METWIVGIFVVVMIAVSEVANHNTRKLIKEQEELIRELIEQKAQWSKKLQEQDLPKEDDK